MHTPVAAQNAKMALHAQNIYNGCCTLQIDFSKLSTLEVRFNNDKSRDYTNLLLPTGGSNADNNNGQSPANETSQYGQYQQNQSIIGQPPNMYNGMQQMQPQHHHHQQQQQVHYQPQQQQQQQQQQHNSFGYQPQQQQTLAPMTQGSPVLLVSNLNEELVTPEALFTLFGVYGDVLRVKILFNKKDSALVNFSNAQQAATAQTHLDRCKLWNKQIRVFPSKHLTVQMPKEGTPDSGLTKDFSNSPLHRFKKPGSKNFNNIFPPAPTLHLSNIPATVSEQEMRDLFATYGVVKAFKFFQKDRKMALVQMESVEEAVTALIATHNYQLAENMHLRCTFSKATV